MLADSVMATILKHYGATEAVYLFGSHATEEAGPASDVDLAILLPPDLARESGPLAMSPCRVELEQQLRGDVDLVNLRLASTVFQNEVINSGRRIASNDEEAALAFEMQVLSAYQKLNEERAGILQSFRETRRAYAV